MQGRKEGTKEQARKEERRGRKEKAGKEGEGREGRRRQRRKEGSRRFALASALNCLRKLPTTEDPMAACSSMLQCGQPKG